MKNYVSRTKKVPFFFRKRCFVLYGLSFKGKKEEDVPILEHILLRNECM